MATNSQFSIAIHLMIALGFNGCGQQVTSSTFGDEHQYFSELLAKDLSETLEGKSGFDDNRKIGLMRTGKKNGRNLAA